MNHPGSAGVSPARLNKGAGFAGEDAGAPRLTASIQVQIAELFSFHEPYPWEGESPLEP